MRSFILNVPIDSLTMSETIQQIDRAIINHIPIHHAAINVAKLINLLKDKELFSVKYSTELIAGYHNGYFNPQDKINTATGIHDIRADILFVAITSPLKEYFLNKYKDLLQIPFIMGVGGSFDVIAGVTKRAPLWMQNMGLEWFFRIIQEPKRMWKRYAKTNAVFIYLVLIEVLKHVFKSRKVFKFN